jgi:hypothetical protein
MKFISSISSPDNGIKESNAIRLIGRGGLQGCEMLKVEYCLDIQLTYGGKVFSLMHRLSSTPPKYIFFYISDTHFPV